MEIVSELKVKLGNQIKDFMKQGEKVKLSFARNLHAAIRKKEIDEKIMLADEQVQEIIMGMLKQRADALEQFQKAQRQDLADKELLEIDYLKTFLPSPLTEPEIQAIIGQTVTELDAKSMADMKKVLASVMEKVGKRSESRIVSELVKKVLMAKV